MNDTAEIFGVTVSLNETSSGHYCIPIDRNEKTSVESVCAIILSELSNEERKQKLLKLHRQFAHPSSKKLKGLLVDAGAWRDDFQPILDEIHSKCDICMRYQRTPSRPVVALPMATQFNEKVCMDLKQWRGKWILHMVDMWSRFSISVFVDRKRPRDIIDKIIKSRFPDQITRRTLFLIILSSLILNTREKFRNS